jgi:hypothetical protein
MTQHEFIETFRYHKASVVHKDMFHIATVKGHAAFSLPSIFGTRSALPSDPLS